MARNDYKWDGNSRDERQSEFSQSGYTTTTSTTVGELHSSWASEGAPRRRRARRAGLLLPILIALGTSTLVLYGVVAYLRG